jgi:hypothetical protein
MWDNIWIVLQGIAHIFEVCVVPVLILIAFSLLFLMIRLTYLVYLQKKRKDAESPILGTVLDVGENDEGLFMRGILTDDGVAFFSKIERNQE